MRSTPWLLGALIALGGCLEPLTAPSAFSEERFLCDAEHVAEFDALVEDCRADRLADPASCAGYVSFRATIDGQPVVVDAPVFEATYQLVSDPPSGQTGRDVFWAAFSPYFRVSLHMIVTVDPATGQAVDFVGDMTDVFNLEARGGNYLTILIDRVRDLRLLTDDEVRMGFSAKISRGGAIEGCYVVFPRQVF